MSTRPPAPTARRAAGLALAVAHLAASVGLPLPASSHAAATGTPPTPCRTKKCGCCTAAGSLGGGCCCSGTAGRQPGTPNWAVAWEPPQCRGPAAGGVIVPPPAVPPAPPVAVACRPEPGDSVAPPADRPVSVPERPPTPPPKSA
jgi:hypothetical protein